MIEIGIHWLALAAGLAISPVPLLLCVLLLCTPMPLANAIAFVLGYSTVPIGLIAAMLTIFSQGFAAGSPLAPGASHSNLAIGVIFFGCAIQQAAMKPRQNVPPRWMKWVDRINPALAYGIGFLAMATNLKNLSLLMAGLHELVQAKLHFGVQLLGAVTLLLGALSGMLTVLTLFLLYPQRSTIVLARIKRWLERHTAIVLCWLFTLLSLMFLWKALASRLG